MADRKYIPLPKSLYLYDFGDSWEHVVTLETVASSAKEKVCVTCLDGARACPPEDCGGITGYENLMAAMADPEHEDREHLVDWLGGAFDPEAFDTAEVNKRLNS